MQHIMTFRSTRLGPMCLIGALVLTAGLSACQPKDAGVSQTEEGQLVLGAVEQTATIERGVALGARTLVLDGFRGDVRLTGTGDNLASLVFTKHARGGNARDAAGVLEGITLQETGDEASYQYVVRAKDPALSRVDVQGEVPRGTRIRLQLGSGNVALSGIDGPVDVKVEGGTVEIAGAAASVSVETRNGSIDLGMYRLPAGSTVHLRATNGNLTLALPGSTAAGVEARTSAGDITTEGLNFADRKLNPEGAGARFQGRLGAGGATILLQTENGAVVLREGTVMRLPPRPGEVVAKPDTVEADTSGTEPVPLPDTLDAAAGPQSGTRP